MDEYMDGGINEHLFGCIQGWPFGYMGERNDACIDGLVHGWTGARALDGSICAWMDDRIYGLMD